jgi:hypothetical protein
MAKERIGGEENSYAGRIERDGYCSKEKRNEREGSTRKCAS